MKPADYRERYEAGESLLDLAHEANCTVREIRELLVNAGATIRGKGAQPGRAQLNRADSPGPSPDGATRGRIVRPSVARMYR